METDKTTPTKCKRNPPGFHDERVRAFIETAPASAPTICTELGVPKAVIHTLLKRIGAQVVERVPRKGPALRIFGYGKPAAPAKDGRGVSDALIEAVRQAASTKPITLLALRKKVKCGQRAVYAALQAIGDENIVRGRQGHQKTVMVRDRKRSGSARVAAYMAAGPKSNATRALVAELEIVIQERLVLTQQLEELSERYEAILVKLGG